jgi:hypothetical protein
VVLDNTGHAVGDEMSDALLAATGRFAISPLK